MTLLIDTLPIAVGVALSSIQIVAVVPIYSLQTTTKLLYSYWVGQPVSWRKWQYRPLPQGSAEQPQFLTKIGSFSGWKIVVLGVALSMLNPKVFVHPGHDQ